MNYCTWFKLSVTLVVWVFALQTSAQSEELFGKDEVITLTLSGNISELLKDRTGDPQYFDAVLSYQDTDNMIVSIPIRAKTRGNFRRAKGTCSYPPLLLHFDRNKSQNTLFSDQDKLKLVMPCQGDEYVIREYLVYKIYNLVTPLSFRARLVKIILDDPKLKSHSNRAFYGLLLEEEEQMAKRNNMVSIDRMHVRPELTQTDAFLNMAVFEYLIGNTDWSVQYRQNVKLIATDTLTRPFPVPYDFDHAGIVHAPYAKPAAELKMSSIRQRRFRGFCINNMDYYEGVLAHYESLKDSIYSLYTSSILLEKGYVKSTVRYLDEFYTIIHNPKKLKEEFQYPCLPNGTGNVVIKGLKE